ncbi:helix-turn-helix domain-containing protein [Tabrizicola sp.]|uniref:helix-turn-helix domain-containing protein n=1 Tax=Tabrizicola sp. TaxID=2005166 RepID=UPI003F2BE504
MTENGETNGWYAEGVATFGDRLSGAREAAGLTREEFATRLGVRLKTVAAWENDASEPRGNRLQMLAGMLNVSMRWLLTGVGDDLEPPDAPGAMTLPAKIALADLGRMRAKLAQLSREMEQTEDRLRQLLQNDMKGAA